MINTIQIVNNRRVAARATLHWNNRIDIDLYISYKKANPVKSFSLICGGNSNININYYNIDKNKLTIKVDFMWNNTISNPYDACTYIINKLKLDIE